MGVLLNSKSTLTQVSIVSIALATSLHPCRPLYILVYASIHLLYHAIENTANQNAGKPLYIHHYSIDQCNSTVSHPTFPSCLAGHCIFYGYATHLSGMPWNIPQVTCIFLVFIAQVLWRGMFHGIPLKSVA